MTKNEDFDDYGPSKTSLKKEATAAQALGEQLLGYNDAFLQSLQLEERLYDAIILAKKINHRNGKKRQLQLVGKLMRNTDTDRIQDAVNKIHLASATEREKQHRAERLRDVLIAQTLKESQHLIEGFDSDIQANITTLTKEAQQLQSGSPKYKKASRNLFRLIFSAL